MSAARRSHPAVHLFSWFVEPVTNRSSKRCTANVRVWGLQTPTSRTWWRSSSIVETVSPTQLVTRFGTNVFLHGSLHRAFAARVHMSAVAMRAFRHGFPSNWKHRVLSSFSPISAIKYKPPPQRPPTRKRVRFDLNLRPFPPSSPPCKRARVSQQPPVHPPATNTRIAIPIAHSSYILQIRRSTRLARKSTHNHNCNPSPPPPPPPPPRTSSRRRSSNLARPSPIKTRLQATRSNAPCSTPSSPLAPPKASRTPNLRSARAIKSQPAIPPPSRRHPSPPPRAASPKPPASNKARHRTSSRSSSRASKRVLETDQPLRKQRNSKPQSAPKQPNRRAATNTPSSRPLHSKQTRVVSTRSSTRAKARATAVESTRTKLPIDKQRVVAVSLTNRRKQPHANTDKDTSNKPQITPALRVAQQNRPVLRPRKRVSFGPETRCDSVASMPEEAIKHSWSPKQRKQFETQRNCVPANHPHYWQRIADGVQGKTAAQCMQLWESSWSSPPGAKRKQVNFICSENEPPKKKPKLSTPQVIQNVQKASRSKRGRNTAKYRTSVRRLADTFARDTEDDVLEPEIVTPKMSYKLSGARFDNPGLDDGTPGTEVRQKRRNADKGGELATPEILKRGKSFGLREADQYVSLFRQRLGTGVIGGRSKQLKPGVCRDLSKKPPPNISQVFELAEHEDGTSLSNDDISQHSDSSCDGDLFF